MLSLSKEIIDWYHNFEKKIDPNRNQLTSHSIQDTQPNKILIPKNHYIAAFISQEVYKDPSKRINLIDEYYLDDKYNTERTVVYKSNLRYEDIFFIGIRGTASSIIDLASDALILVGKDNYSQRKGLQTLYIKEIVNDLINQGYNTIQSYICGHSLGGLLTAYAIEEIPEIVGIGINVGSSPSQIKPNLNFLKREKQLLQNRKDNLRFVNYHMDGDLLSASSVQLFIDTVIIRPRPTPQSVQEAHSLNFFLKSTSPFPFINNLY